MWNFSLKLINVSIISLIGFNGGHLYFLFIFFKTYFNLFHVTANHITITKKDRKEIHFFKSKFVKCRLVGSRFVVYK